MKDDRDEYASDHPFRAVCPVIEIEKRRQGQSDEHDPYRELDECFSRPVNLGHDPDTCLVWPWSGRPLRIEAVSMTSTLRMGLVGFPVAWPDVASDMPLGAIDDVQHFFFRNPKACCDELYRVVFRNASVRVSREQLQNCQVTGTWTYDKTSPLATSVTVPQISRVRLCHRNDCCRLRVRSAQLAHFLFPQ